MTSHQQDFEQLAAAAERYIAQAQAITVAAGSEMEQDDLFLAPVRRSFREAPWQLIGSAADHLRLVGAAGARQAALNPFAPATLVRGAITSASAAVWVLHGDQQLRRTHMLQLLASDSHSYRMFITNMSAAFTTPDQIAKRDRELEEMDRRENWIVTQYNLITGSDKKGVSGVAKTTSDTETVRTAGNLLNPALATRGMSTGEEVLAMWQACSGYAHARPWPYLPSKTPVGPVDAAGMQQVRIDGDPKFYLEGAVMAMELMDEAFRLVDTLVK